MTELKDKDLEYATETRKARRKTGLKTQEFFTPEALVKKMCDKISDEDWKDPDKTFLEPSFGNGNFLVEIIRRRLDNGIDVYQVLRTTYGVELMPDNVMEAKQRILKMLQEMGIQIDRNKALKIMNTNLVCSDFFKWDFENWKPMYEIKQLELNFE